MDKISEKIKAARIAKGVTIEEVAEATLLSVNIIKDIEDGAFERFVGDELYVKMYLNVLEWEIKRRCVKAEYIASLPKPTLLDKVKNKAKKFLERR